MADPESEREASRSASRLGRVERVILETLIRHDGLTLRGDALQAAFPALARPEWKTRRAAAEAATTRAIESLVRKGLLLKERNERTGQVLLRSLEAQPVPGWEAMARAEEDLAAYCRKTAHSWRELAWRARLRAARIRADRSDESTEAERLEDLQRVEDLERPAVRNRAGPRRRAAR